MIYLDFLNRFSAQFNFSVLFSLSLNIYSHQGEKIRKIRNKQSSEARAFCDALTDPIHSSSIAQSSTIALAHKSTRQIYPLVIHIRSGFTAILRTINHPHKIKNKFD